MAEQIEQTDNGNISPNIDNELDAALSKSFAGDGNQVEQSPVVKENKTPNEVAKAPAEEPIKQEVKQEVRKEESKKVEKPVDDKPLITPEQADKMDPKKQDGWNAIRNSNKKAHSMIQEREAEIAKLKATLAEKSNLSQKELDSLKAEKADLEKYRAMVDIQADPEFISKYDKPVKDAIDGIKVLIKGMQVSQETVDAIDFNDPQRLQQIVDIIAQNKDRFTAAKIERKITEYLQLNDKRNETLDQQKLNYKETLEKRKQELFAKGAEGDGRMLKHLQLKATEKDAEGKPLIPFLNKIEPKENATQAEIDQVNNHNGLVDLMSKKLDEVMKMKEPEQQAEIAIAAVASHYLISQNRALNQQLKNAQEELKKVSVVQTEAPVRKSNNPSGRNGNSEPLDTDQALASFGFGRR